MNWSDAEKDTVRSMHEAGATYPAIARAVGNGRTAKAISGLAFRLNLPKRSTDKTTKMNEAKAQHRKTRAAGLKKVAPTPMIEATIPHAPFLFPDGSPVTMESLGSRMCKFPIGGSRVEEMTFCGLPRKGHGPYCERCHAIAFRPNNPNARLSEEDKANMEQMSRVAGSQRIFG